MPEIYRKSSLEKLASPDHLDKMVSIISPKSWIILLAGIIIIIALTVWSIFGQIAEYTKVPGIYVEDTNGLNNAEKGQIICYSLLKDSKNIKEGMKVTVIPLNINEKEYGHLTGSINKISSSNVTYDEMENKLVNKELVQYFNNYFNNNPIVEVEIHLEEGSTVSGYKWSSSKGENLSLENNMLVDANIILKVEKPIKKLLSSFSGILK